MTPTEFLITWIEVHISATTEQADAGNLTELLLVCDAAREGIDREALEAIAGRGLDIHVSDTIWAAVEEAQWGTDDRALLS